MLLLSSATVPHWNHPRSGKTELPDLEAKLSRKTAEERETSSSGIHNAMVV